MSKLFDTARSSVAYHINNIFKEDGLDKNTSVEIFDRSERNASIIKEEIKVSACRSV